MSTQTFFIETWGCQMNVDDSDQIKNPDLNAQLAIVNRSVVENYPESAAVPEALQMLVKNYKALGMNDLASQAEGLLKSTQTQQVN